MPPKPHRFLDEAEAEFLDAALYYSEASRANADLFIDEIERLVRRACEFPFSGLGSPKDTRRLTSKRFPYVL